MESIARRAYAQPEPDELAEFRRELRVWLSAAAIPPLAGDLDTRFIRFRQWQRDLYAAGFIGLAWPKAWGGQGKTPMHQLILTEELCRSRAPQPIGLIGLDVVGPSIARYGTDEQRKLLPPMLSGENIWCQGFSEPNAGSDLAAIATTVTRDKDSFVLSGQKIWTSWGHKADMCAVLARSDAAGGHRGLSYLIVDMKSPGVTTRSIRQMTGESEFCEVFFDDVVVPAENLVGELNEGWGIAMDTLSNERGSFALRRRGEISVAFDDAVDIVCEAIDADSSRLPEYVLESLGRSFVELELLGAQNRQTVERMMAGGGPSPVDSVDKLVLTSVEQIVYRSLYDLLGDSALSNRTTDWGLDAATLSSEYLYSRAASIYGGTEQIQRNIVAERLLGLPKGT